MIDVDSTVNVAGFTRYTKFKKVQLLICWSNYGCINTSRQQHAEVIKPLPDAFGPWCIP